MAVPTCLRPPLPSQPLHQATHHPAVSSHRPPIVPDPAPSLLHPHPPSRQLPLRRHQQVPVDGAHRGRRVPRHQGGQLPGTGRCALLGGGAQVVVTQGISPTGGAPPARKQGDSRVGLPPFKPACSNRYQLFVSCRPVPRGRQGGQGTARLDDVEVSHTDAPVAAAVVGRWAGAEWACPGGTACDLCGATVPSPASPCLPRLCLHVPHPPHKPPSPAPPAPGSPTTALRTRAPCLARHAATTACATPSSATQISSGCRGWAWWVSVVSVGGRGGW